MIFIDRGAFIRMSEIKLDQFVYEYIIQKIKTGEFLPMQHITEQEIVKKLEVSRTPVRKAFDRLVDDKYLKDVKNVGVHIKVRELTSKEFQDRVNLIENLLNYYLFEIEKEEIYFEVGILKQINKEMKNSISDEESVFENRALEYFRKMLSYNKNNYEKEIILRAIREILLNEGYISSIIKDSRKVISNHLTKIIEYLEKNNYSLARREIRILLNQLKLNVIENSRNYK